MVIIDPSTSFHLVNSYAGSTHGFVGFSCIPFCGWGSSALPIIILTFSDAWHPPPPCSISLSTSTRLQFFFRFRSTYIQLSLLIHIPFCTSHPNLFSPHLASLLTFLPALILPPVDCGPTPTLGRPFPGNGGISNGWQGVFVFPPPSESSQTTSSSPSSPGPSNLHPNRNSTVSGLEFWLQEDVSILFGYLLHLLLDWR